jgi:hypothetical protein
VTRYLRAGRHRTGCPLPLLLAILALQAGQPRPTPLTDAPSRDVGYGLLVALVIVLISVLALVSRLHPYGA